MFSTILLTALAVALTASAGVVERVDVATPATTLRAVTHDGKDLGPLWVTSTGTTLVGASLSGSNTAPTTFYISDPVDRLYTGSPDILTFAPKPHGVLQFSIPVAQFCKLSGPLIFTSNETISSAGCNISTGFGFKGRNLVMKAPGGWEVCASGRGPTATSQVYFTQSDPVVAESSCVAVDIVKPLVAIPY